MTNVLSLEQNTPRSTSLSKLLEIHEINFEENWRYRTLSKLETLFHVTNVTTVLNASVVSDRVSRCICCETPRSDEFQVVLENRTRRFMHSAKTRIPKFTDTLQATRLGFQFD